MVTPAVGTTGASIFAGASSPSVYGGEVSNSQRDQNRATVIINIGGSDSDTSLATLAASETSRPGSVRNAHSDQEQNSILEEEPSISGGSGFGSETSLEIVDLPTEERRPSKETVRTSKVIYEHHMLLQGNGMPLYIPQPGTVDCHSYQRQGVSIGDVGVFTPSGGFDRFFNICFYPLDLKPADVYQVYGYALDSYIASLPVPRMGTTFRCPKLEGAILTLPQGAYQEDLRRKVERFRDYTSIHLRSWYDYANVVNGQEIDNKDIHLVIGCDKTTSWGIATYSHRQSTRVEDNVTTLSFNVKEESRRSLYSKYAWDVDGIAAGLKVGPEEAELLDPPAVHAITPLRNQCTFIRSLNPALGDDEWEQHQLKVAASAEAPASPRPTRKSHLASVLGAIRSLPRRLGSSRGHGSSGSTDSMAPTQTGADHPASPILDMLLQKCPRAKVVVVSDSDWCSVIRDSDKDWITTAQDLPRRIQEAFDIVEDENGTVYLQEKMRSSPRLGTPSHVSVKLEDEDLPLLGDRKPGVSQLFDQISHSNIKADSPPRTFDMLDDDIKSNIYPHSGEGHDDDLGDEDDAVLDATFLEFVLRQIQKTKRNASFIESSSLPRFIKTLADDDDKAGSSKGEFMGRKDSPWLDAAFVQFISSQIQKMKNSKTDGRFKLDTEELDDKDRIMLNACKVMFQRLKNSKLSFEESSPPWRIQKSADDCDDDSKPNLFDDPHEADLESASGIVRRGAKFNHRAPSGDEDYSMSEATLPELNSQIYKEENTGAGDVMFDDEVSGSRTPDALATPTLPFRQLSGELHTNDALDAFFEDSVGQASGRDHVMGDPFSDSESDSSVLDLPSFGTPGNDLPAHSHTIRRVAPQPLVRPSLARTTSKSARFSCSLCSQTFGNKTILRLHLDTHLDLNTCPNCRERFGSRRSLHGHLETSLCRGKVLGIEPLWEPIQWPSQKNLYDEVVLFLGAMATQRVAGQLPLSSLPRSSFRLP